VSVKPGEVHTGSNLLDADQPIFTLVGIGVKNLRHEHIAKQIKSLKSKYKIGDDVELHTKSVFKRGKEKIARDIMEILIEDGVELFFSLVEKRFAIATFIESVFLIRYSMTNVTTLGLILPHKEMRILTSCTKYYQMNLSLPVANFSQQVRGYTELTNCCSGI
jgi:hypothetical protein